MLTSALRVISQGGPRRDAASGVGAPRGAALVINTGRVKLPVRLDMSTLAGLIGGKRSLIKLRSDS